MRDRDLNYARGWVYADDNKWRRPVLSDADRRAEGQAFDREADVTLMRRTFDMNDALEHGSVTYRPTVEQQRLSPWCQALGAEGVTERETIERLFLALMEAEARIRQLTNSRPLAPVVMNSIDREGMILTIRGQLKMLFTFLGWLFQATGGHLDGQDKEPPESDGATPRDTGEF